MPPKNPIRVSPFQLLSPVPSTINNMYISAVSVCWWHFVLIQTSLHKFWYCAQYLKWLYSLFKSIPLVLGIVVNRSPKGEIKLFQQQVYFSSFSKNTSFIPLVRVFVLCLERCVIYTCILVQMDVAFFCCCYWCWFWLFYFPLQYVCKSKISYSSYSSTWECLLSNHVLF